LVGYANEGDLDGNRPARKENKNVREGNGRRGRTKNLSKSESGFSRTIKKSEKTQRGKRKKP